MFITAHCVEFYQRRGQDRVDVITHPRGVVLVAADGAGGTSGGAEAADTVILWTKAHATGSADLTSAAAWRDLLARIDRQLSLCNGQSTAVIAAVFEDRIVGASVGDSAAWIIQGEACANLTVNQVHKPLLGTGAAKPVEFEYAGGLDGVLLLASDGLVKYAPLRRIVQVVQRHQDDLAPACCELIDLVRLKSRSLPDDVAVILCRRRDPRDGASRSQRRVYSLSTVTGELADSSSSEDDPRP